MLKNLLLGLLLIGVSFNAVSALVYHHFSGKITELKNIDFSIDDPFNGTVNIGTEFYGFYIYDSEKAYNDGDACDIGSQCRWEFLIPPSRFVVTVGSLTIEIPEDFTILQTDSVTTDGNHWYTVSSADYFDIEVPLKMLPKFQYF